MSILNPHEELQRMKDEEFAKRYPNVPSYAKPKPKKVKSPANQLTNDVISHIILTGGWATRINSMGRVLNGKYIPGSTQKGVSDIMACINGKFIAIEIKIKDKLSEDQIKFSKQIEKSGGKYFVVHNIDEYFSILNKI